MATRTQLSAERGQMRGVQDKRDPPCVAMVLSAHRFFGGKRVRFPPATAQAVVLRATDPSTRRARRGSPAPSLGV